MSLPYDSLYSYDGIPLLSGLANGTTLSIIRQRTAQELGPFLAGTATSGSNTAVLVDNTWPITSGLNVDDLYIDQYLFRPNATLISDKVRIVKSYSPLIGELVPDQAWTNAPAVGETYELHGVIDPWTVLPVLINQALIRIMVVTEFSFSPIKDQNRHSLATAAPWLINPRWIRSVGYLSQGPLSTPTTTTLHALEGTNLLTVEDTSGATIGDTAIIASGNLDGSDFHSVITAISHDIVTVGSPTISINGHQSPNIITTVTAHGLITGDTIAVTSTFPGESGAWTVTVTNPTTFTLNGANFNYPFNFPILASFVQVIAPTELNSGTVTITDSLPQIISTDTMVTFQRINEERDQVDPFMRSVRGKAIGVASQQGMVTYLEHPGQVFDPTVTMLYVRAIAPAYYVCKGASYPQYGLTSETDTAPVTADWIAAMTLNEAWRHYAHVLEPIANQRLIRDRQEAGAWLSDLSAKYFQLPPMEFRPLTRWGSWVRSGGPQLWGP